MTNGQKAILHPDAHYMRLYIEKGKNKVCMSGQVLLKEYGIKRPAKGRIIKIHGVDFTLTHLSKSNDNWWWLKYNITKAKTLLKEASEARETEAKKAYIAKVKVSKTNKGGSNAKTKNNKKS